MIPENTFITSPTIPHQNEQKNSSSTPETCTIPEIGRSCCPNSDIDMQEDVTTPQDRERNIQLHISHSITIQPNFFSETRNKALGWQNFENEKCPSIDSNNNSVVSPSHDDNVLISTTVAR